jgi:hypothetical protein
MTAPALVDSAAVEGQQRRHFTKDCWDWLGLLGTRKMGVIHHGEHAKINNMPYGYDQHKRKAVFIFTG